MVRCKSKRMSDKTLSLATKLTRWLVTSPAGIPGESAVPTGTFGRPARRAGLSQGEIGKEEPPEEPNACEIYERLVIGTGEEELLSACLHKAVDMQKDKLWQLLAAEFPELIEPEEGDKAGVPEDDFFDMSVEELASKLEYGVQPLYSSRLPRR